jgi:hypothetical protein
MGGVNFEENDRKVQITQLAMKESDTSVGQSLAHDVGDYWHWPASGEDYLPLWAAVCILCAGFNHLCVASYLQ